MIRLVPCTILPGLADGSYWVSVLSYGRLQSDWVQTFVGAEDVVLDAEPAAGIPGRGYLKAQHVVDHEHYSLAIGDAVEVRIWDWNRHTQHRAIVPKSVVL